MAGDSLPKVRRWPGEELLTNRTTITKFFENRRSQSLPFQEQMIEEWGNPNQVTENNHCILFKYATGTVPDPFFSISVAVVARSSFPITHNIEVAGNIYVVLVMYQCGSYLADLESSVEKRAKAKALAPKGKPLRHQLCHTATPPSRPKAEDCPSGPLPGNWACHGWLPENIPWQRVHLPSYSAPRSGPRPRPWPRLNYRWPQTKPR